MYLNIFYEYNIEEIRTKKKVNEKTANYYFVKNMQGDIIEVLDEEFKAVVKMHGDGKQWQPSLLEQ